MDTRYVGFGRNSAETSTRFITAGGPVDQGSECSENPSSTRPVGGGGAKDWKATKSVHFIRNCNKGAGGDGVLYSGNGGRGKPGRTNVSDYEDDRCRLGLSGSSHGIVDDNGWADGL